MGGGVSPDDDSLGGELWSCSLLTEVRLSGGEQRGREHFSVRGLIFRVSWLSGSPGLGPCSEAH